MIFNRFRSIISSILIAMITIALTGGWQLTGTVVYSAAAQQTPSATKPTISAQVNGQPFNGVAGSYCWHTDTPACSIVDDPQPATSAAVKAGDKVAFSVQPTAKLDTFSARLLDDLADNGNPIEIDLTNSKGILTVDPTLANGVHRIEVNAAYPADAVGNQDYVTYVFGLQVSGSNAIAAVPTDATAQAVSTDAATMQSTMQATAALSMTAAATDSATVVTTAVAVATSSTMTTASAATVNATAASANATTTTTAIATSVSTAANTKVATQRPTVQATRAVNTTPTRAPTIAPPTATVAATSIPIATSVTAIAAVPTTIPGVAPTVTPSGVMLNLTQFVPTLNITTSGKQYDPVAISATLQTEDGTQIAITRPINANAPYIRAAAGSDAQIIFSGPRPTSEVVTVLNSDATKTLNQQTVTPDNLVLYTLPAQAGIYVITVDVKWPSGKAIYYFRAAVEG